MLESAGRYDAGAMLLASVERVPEVVRANGFVMCWPHLLRTGGRPYLPVETNGEWPSPATDTDVWQGSTPTRSTASAHETSRTRCATTADGWR